MCIYINIQWFCKVAYKFNKKKRGNLSDRYKKRQNRKNSSVMSIEQNEKFNILKVYLHICCEIFLFSPLRNILFHKKMQSFQLWIKTTCIFQYHNQKLKIKIDWFQSFAEKLFISFLLNLLATLRKHCIVNNPTCITLFKMNRSIILCSKKYIHFSIIKWHLRLLSRRTKRDWWFCLYYIILNTYIRNTCISRTCFLVFKFKQIQRAAAQINQLVSFIK